MGVRADPPQSLCLPRLLNLITKQPSGVPQAHVLLKQIRLSLLVVQVPDIRGNWSGDHVSSDLSQLHCGYYMPTVLYFSINVLLMEGKVNRKSNPQVRRQKHPWENAGHSGDHQVRV